MFEDLEQLPTDPILGLMALFSEDPSPNKIDLGVGVYRDEQGQTPIMRAVKLAEQEIVATQTSKSYVGPSGNPEFKELLTKLIFGQGSPICSDSRIASVQTPGGCGALRIAAELILKSRPGASVWVSDPTWGNHIPLLGDCGLNIRTYTYLSEDKTSLNFEGMVASLSQVPEGDVVLLHGSCHNPSGVDLAAEQWREVARLAGDIGFIPFVDSAYQGFGAGVEEDAYGIRYLSEHLPEVILAASCSKNFGLYKERVGLVAVVAKNSAESIAIQSYMLSIARGIYSMPPDHGAAIVAKVLAQDPLRDLWLQELEAMRVRILDLRKQFSEAMYQRTGSDRFDFVKRQQGMFSFLGLSASEVGKLRADHSVFMLDSSRANIAGLRTTTVDPVCDAIARVIENVA